MKIIFFILSLTFVGCRCTKVYTIEAETKTNDIWASNPQQSVSIKTSLEFRQ